MKIAIDIDVEPKEIAELAKELQAQQKIILKSKKL